MKFDLDTLIKILGKAQTENSSGEVKFQQSYLYQNVFLPISQGRNVWVKDLDFSQFTSSDIIDLDEYLGDTLIFHCLGFYMCLPLCGGKGSALSRWPWSIKVICGPQQNCSFIPFPMYQRADICVWDAIPCPDATAYIRCPVCRHTLCQCQTTTTIFFWNKIRSNCRFGRCWPE